MAANDGSFFSNMREKIAVGGWINPTTYSVGQTYCPIFNTRQGPGQPIFLYPSIIAAVIEVTAKTSHFILCDRSSGAVWMAPKRTFTGTLNPSSTANLIMGMHAATYYFAGGFDDWFLEIDSRLTIDDLAQPFMNALLSNGADSPASVDALTEPGVLALKAVKGVYPASGVLYTKGIPCALSGSGRVAAASEYTVVVTSVSLTETSTSDDVAEWSAWQAVGASGELQSPNRQYTRFLVTLTTADTLKTPKLLEIQLHDITKLYEKIGFARPVILDGNGAETLEFKLPFHDSKRRALENEKQVQFASGIYQIRTLTDKKATTGTSLRRFTPRRHFTTCPSARKRNLRTLTQMPPTFR